MDRDSNFSASRPLALSGAKKLSQASSAMAIFVAASATVTALRMVGRRADSLSG